MGKHEDPDEKRGSSDGSKDKDRQGTFEKPDKGGKHGKGSR